MTPALVEGQTGRVASRTSETARIILLSELYPPAVGGSAVLFHEIYSRMLDFDVAVLTEPRAGGHMNSLEHLRIHDHAVATPHWGLTRPAGARNHWRTAAAVRNLARGGPGVVHCARALPEGLAAWLASHLYGPRYVCWSHGEDLVTARSSREYELLTTRILKGARFCIANSRNTAGLISGFGVNEDRIRLVYPGVDPVRFSPDVDGSGIRGRLGFSRDNIVLLSVGRLCRRKGHDLAIRTVASLRNQLPHLRYIVVGDGEDRAYLEGIVRECGVGDMVQLIGEVAGDELPHYYAVCDIFLLPNRVERGDIEGFGIVFLEAASAGRPVIAGTSGGVPEAVADGTTGVLVGGTDEAELAQAIHRLAQDSFLRRRMGSAGRERVLSRFTWSRAAQAVAELHREAAAAGGRRQKGHSRATARDVAARPVVRPRLRQIVEAGRENDGGVCTQDVMAARHAPVPPRSGPDV